MYDKNEKIFKITTIVLAVLLVLVLGYVAYDKYKTFQNTQLLDAYNNGINQGSTNVVSQIYQLTENCAVVPLNVANNTRNIADVACIQKAIQQGLPPQQTAQVNTNITK